MTRDKRSDGADVSYTGTPKLSIDEPTVIPTRRTQRGFDPYDGAISRKSVGAKKDLRKLGAWIEAKRKAEAIKKGE